MMLRSPPKSANPAVEGGRGGEGKSAQTSFAETLQKGDPPRSFRPRKSTRLREIPSGMRFKRPSKPGDLQTTTGVIGPQGTAIPDPS